VQPDLWETDSEAPFPGLTTHAYVLATPEDGNVLLYGTTHEHELDAIAALGGLDRHYLSHRDEAAPSLATIRERFGSRLLVPAAEREAIERFGPVDGVLEAREAHPGGIEVIPTPGHSPGSTSFLVTSPTGLRYLFTGDTLYLGADGRWRAGYIEKVSDADAMAMSLEVLAALSPDVVISSAYAGASGVTSVDARWWPAFVEEAAAQLPSRRASNRLGATQR
jgi:hydroxyacylglutathione hydrolase